MALYPMKVLLDKDRKVFIPFIPADAIPINGSDETVTQALANRYTKAEMDAIIQGLGTLQVLRGRVATRADLDNIQNPKAGDTYIVGTSTTNNSEWMWIGDAWEELGPMIELEDYYTKEEVYNKTETYNKVETESRIDEKISEIPTPDMSNYYTKDETYNKTETDSKIDEKIAEIPSPDMSNYYTKPEADTKIDEKINAIPVINLLHYKGHVNSVDDLPSTGQESGELIGTPVNINAAIKGILNGETMSAYNAGLVDTIKSLQGINPYFIGFGGADGNSGGFVGRSGIFFMDIEQLKGVAVYSTGDYRYFLFELDASTDKPVTVKCRQTGGSNSYRIAAADLNRNKLFRRDYLNYNNWNTNTVTVPCIVTISTARYVDRASIVSNVNVNIKYKAQDFMWSSTGDSLTDLTNKTETAYHAYDSSKIYYTNTGMNFLSFNPETCIATILQNDPSPLAVENSMYTVGDNNDIYVCDAAPHWNLWSKADLENYYNKQEVDDKFNDIELFKFPNATIIGEPTINNGQISDFTSQDYLQFPFIIDFRGRPFTINACFTTGDNVVNQENIFDSLFGFAFAIQNSHFVLAMSSNGTSWDIGAIVGTYVVLPNTTYYIKISWDGTQYTLSYSLDKQEYRDDIVEESELSLYPKQVVIGVGDLSTGTPKVFSGIINMNYCDLTISDKLVWSGMDSVGIASRADVSLSNIDDAGKQVIKDIVDNAIRGSITEVLGGEY